MGSTGLKTLRYAGNGTGFTFGQAYTPGGVWPKITVHSMTRTIDYDGGAMRDEIVLSRAEPLGGGGYPVSGEQRNDQFINGEIAWNQTGTTATPGPRFVTDRMHQLWITPHGALKAAQRNRATARRNADGTTHRLVQPARPLQRRPCSSAPTASSRRSTRSSPIRCSATPRRSRRIPTTAISAA